MPQDLRTRSWPALSASENGCALIAPAGHCRRCWSARPRSGALNRALLRCDRKSRHDMQPAHDRCAPEQIRRRATGPEHSRRICGHRCYRRAATDSRNQACRPEADRDGAPVRSRAMNLKNPLCQIQPDDANIFHGYSLLPVTLPNITLAHRDAVGRGYPPHHF